MSRNTLGVRSFAGMAMARVAGIIAVVGAAATASAQLVVNEDLGVISGTTERLLTGSYAGRPNNAEMYLTPAGSFRTGGKNLGEYVFQFTTTTRGRVSANWLIGSGVTPTRLQSLAIVDTLAVDPSNMSNSGVRYYNNPNDPSDLSAIIEPGTYYTVFDDATDPITNEVLNPSGNFRALLDFQTLRLSAPISGETSMSNIWGRPRYGGPGSDPEIPGYTAAYADPIPFWVDEFGTYALTNILASYGLVGYFFSFDPTFPVSFGNLPLNPNDSNAAYLQPNRQYWLVVSTYDDVIPNPWYPDFPVATPGAFTVQLEGAGNVTLGIVPAPSTGFAMAVGMLFAARRRR